MDLRKLLVPLVIAGCLAFVGGCAIPHMPSPVVIPVTNMDSIAGWLPTDLRADSSAFARLRSRVASLSDADAFMRISITPDGRFNARIPDEVIDHFGGSQQDTLLALDGTWRYTADNHHTVGVQFISSESPQRTFLGFLHHRRGQLVMIIALGDYDSGNLLILPAAKDPTG